MDSIPAEHKNILKKQFHVRADVAKNLSDSELQMLMVYGQWLAALEHRRIEPYTDSQKEFLMVWL